MSVFHFKQFDVANDVSAMKLGTDSVLLGACALIPEGVRRVLDVGTGTGVVALMIAQRTGGTAHIDAIDIDAPSVSEAQANFAASPWRGSLRAEHCALGDWPREKEYDLIVSNPPFFDDSLLNPDSRVSAARHTLSLSYRDLCAYASETLSEDGVLAMVLPAETQKALVRTAVSFSLYPRQITLIRTTERKPVRRIVACFTKRRCECSEVEVTMMEGGEYTTRYRSLVETFLLNL